MKRLALAFVAIALVAAACSSADDAQVASLDATTDTAASEGVDVAAANEEIILEFSQCMRDNGAEDFEDPLIGPDGAIEFKFDPAAQGSPEERDAMRAAFDACQETLQGFAFGPGTIDRSAIEDTLYEFAVCMRGEGIDVPDPDFTRFLSGEDVGGPFGDAVDRDDPEFLAALEVCSGVFGGTFRLGGDNG